MNQSTPELHEKVIALEQHVARLDKQLRHLESSAARAQAAPQIAKPVGTAQHRVEGPPDTFVIPIVSLAPKPFRVLTPIPILIEAATCADSEEFEYVARFVEANVGSGGDTIEEALHNIKDRLAAKFRILDRTPPERLGKGPARQLAVLRSVMAKADEWAEEAEPKSQKS